MTLDVGNSVQTPKLGSCKFSKVQSHKERHWEAFIRGTCSSPACDMWRHVDGSCTT